jgi:hypothetical protein
MTRLLSCLALGAVIVLGPARALSQEVTITIKQHRFEPAEIKVPAKKRVSITVINDDPTPEEFESRTLRVEKVIAGKTKARVQFGPLEPGRYDFVGEFHEDTANGAVIAE